MKKNKAFTLIELIAVLVILAILALIVTPLVMNIIRKARISADKRSIDAYGRSIELAIASYLLDEGKFPSSINDLTIEYSGDEVVCSTTQLNDDSSVYLTGCTVKGRTVDYAYGKYEEPTYVVYSVGDEVTYNGVDYYVIKDSGVKEQTVTLLKVEPLTVAEVNQYGGVETQDNHVNMHVRSSENFYQTAYNQNGYGGVQYYSSISCGYNGSDWVTSGCKTNYDESEIKYIVDAWAIDKVSAGLQEARLIKSDEYNEFLIVETYNTPTNPGTRYTPIYEWQNNNAYNYWTMSSNGDSSVYVNIVMWSGLLGSNDSSNGGSYGAQPGDFYWGCAVVRPVIVLNKSYLSNE